MFYMVGATGIPEGCHAPGETCTIIALDRVTWAARNPNLKLFEDQHEYSKTLNKVLYFIFHLYCSYMLAS